MSKEIDPGHKSPKGMGLADFCRVTIKELRRKDEVRLHRELYPLIRRTSLGEEMHQRVHGKPKRESLPHRLLRKLKH